MTRRSTGLDNYSKAHERDTTRTITSLSKEFEVSRTTIRRILSETAV